MRKAVVAVGLVLIALGVPIAVYYASFLTYNNSNVLTPSPDMATRFQLTAAVGASLALLGGVLAVGGLIRTPRRK